MESTIVLNLNFLSYYHQKLMVFKEKTVKVIATQKLFHIIT